MHVNVIRVFEVMVSNVSMWTNALISPIFAVAAKTESPHV